MCRSIYQKRALLDAARVQTALRAIGKKLPGPLPAWDRYQEMKSGRLHWPPAQRITEYFGCMARAWLEAGFDSDRVILFNVAWLPGEDEYLLQHAGTMTLKEIAKHLHRHYQAVRARLEKNHNMTARGAQGYWSAAELAKEYNCSCHRIREALRCGKIKGRFDHKRNRWEIDIADVWASASALMILHRPKGTHKNVPTDLGDYYRRHGLKRIMLNGKLTCVPASK